MKPWPKLMLALDVPLDEVGNVLDDLGDRVPCFKVGLGTIVSPYLNTVVKRVLEKGAKLFLDGKLHDIPNTVANASGSLVELGASYFTVHASGGRAMMEASRKAAEDRAAKLGFDEVPVPVAVTVLTSTSQDAWEGLYRTSVKIEDQVLHFVDEAMQAGLSAVVASPLEVEAIRARFGSELSIITPGVRPRWAAKGDQKRIATPADALKRGATALVIGRPILFPPESVGSREEAVNRIAEEMGGLEAS